MAQESILNSLMDEEHVGSRSCYVHNKCRRAECKKANADYKRNKTGDYRTATASTNATLNAAGLPFADPKLTHGLPSTYEWYGCRCLKCTAAHTEREQVYRLLRELEEAS